MRIVFLLFLLLGIGVSAQSQTIIPGAERPQLYLPLIMGQRIGLVINQTSRVHNQHLLDFLRSKNIDVVNVFTPEHGFRGQAEAGEQVANQRDAKTGIPIVSLYGKNKKPTANQLKDVDVVIFDIQDVGVRFYTYVSTLHYVMEACAENKKELLVFDRPNPNGDYIAGPVLKPEFRSFVGMDPIPVVHGCTVGELARMMNGEGWLKDHEKCDLLIIPMYNYTHNKHYSLPVKPSPNLPNNRAIRLYPSLCFFEATSVSIGRGTPFPFQVIGYPDQHFGDFEFTPESIEGVAARPKQEGQKCFGVDLRKLDMVPHFTLSYFLNFYHQFKNERDFLSRERWFNLLAGTNQVLKDIRAGKSEAEIEAGWQEDLKKYQFIRKKYLLYPDFN
ncbi:MAG TPA: DUF1343 domain-containing protein [Sunxiuqinia sp.]|nr:DUF1343 domain-containing protein [Sunxiuqinia sp.]